MVSLAVSLLSLSYAMVQWRGWVEAKEDLRWTASGEHRSEGEKALVEAMTVLEVAFKVGLYSVFGATFRGWLYVAVAIEYLVKTAVIVGHNDEAKAASLLAWLAAAATAVRPC